MKQRREGGEAVKDRIKNTSKNRVDKNHESKKTALVHIFKSEQECKYYSGNGCTHKRNSCLFKSLSPIGELFKVSNQNREPVLGRGRRETLDKDTTAQLDRTCRGKEQNYHVPGECKDTSSMGERIRKR